LLRNFFVWLRSLNEYFSRLDAALIRIFMLSVAATLVADVINPSAQGIALQILHT